MAHRSKKVTAKSLLNTKAYRPGVYRASLRFSVAGRLFAALIFVATIAPRAAIADALFYSDFTIPSEDPCYGWCGAPLDLDLDGAPDFYFHSGGSDCMAGCLRTLSGLGVSAELDWGAMIDPNVEFDASVGWSCYASGCFDGPGSDRPGIPTFVGILLQTDAGIHFGWIRLMFSLEYGPWLLDYAYESNPREPIRAGTGYPCAGDLDWSGTIEISDVSILLSHFGTPNGATYADGDLDADSDVDLADLVAMLENFGTTCPW